MAHILFMPKARIDAIGRTSILFRLARRIFAKILYQRVFRVAECKLWDFRSLRLRIDTQNTKIQYGVSNMADQDVKIYFIEMKIITRWFSRSLITYISEHITYSSLESLNAH